MESTGVDTGEARKSLFESARDNFLGSLSETDKLLFSPCATSTDFLDGLQKLEKTTEHFGRVGKKIRYVRSFTEHLKPYFEVVNIFIQSNPEFSAIFWGAFRLVLQLSSNLSSFFEKLLGLISQLLDVFPRYEDVAKLCDDENSDRLRRNIEEVYGDMLEILKAAVKIFTKSTGRSLLWQPFDVKFKKLLDKMATHKENIAQEVRIWRLRKEKNERNIAATWRNYVQKEHAKSEQERNLAREERRLMAEERKLMEKKQIQDAAAQKEIVSLLLEIKEEKERLEAERLESMAFKIREWLQPVDYFDARQTNARARERYESTATWIFDHPQYRSWVQSNKDSCPDGNVRLFGPNTLWLHGHPGSGKTVLATSIIDELENYENGYENQGEDVSPTVLYHFFQFDSQFTRPPTAAYKSLLAQYLWRHRNNKDVVDKFAFIMRIGSQGQIGASEKALLDLLEICLNKGVFIILDGVDECEDSDSFTKSLLRLSMACNHKTLLLSRINMTHLQRSVRSESKLLLTKEDTSQDIHRFCQYGLDDMIVDELLPDLASNELDKLNSHLLKGADGMFLWAKLIVEITTEIQFPEGLEDMYDRIFSEITQSGEAVVKFTTTVFIWLSNQAALITTYQICQAFSVNGLWMRGGDVEDIKEFETAVLMACGGLVEIVPITSTGRVLKFVHLTAREALASSKIGDTSRSPSISNLELGRSCLRQLIHHKSQGPLSGKVHQSISSARLASSFPFTDYAALHWMEHLKASISSESDGGAWLEKVYKDVFEDFAKDLQLFFESPRAVTAWLEAYYTAQKDISPRGKIVHCWADWASEASQRSAINIKGDVLRLALEFCSDLDRIAEVWNEQLTHSPHIIWDEVTADGWTPSRLFFSPGGTRVKSRAPEKPQLEGIADVPFMSVSAVCKDGSALGVLSIWSFNRENFVERHVQEIHRDYKNMPKSFPQIWVAFPDCLVFSVAYQIWMLRPPRPPEAMNLAELEWPANISYEAATIETKPLGFAKTDNESGQTHIVQVTFSPTGQYITLTETNLISLEMRMSSFEIMSFPMMAVKPLNVLESV
ncbi:uncharacterized protein F4822DRAFT_428480 [Hypoxylon trugodes]|uniref:uncharacterized protein n=1 Tax=Hypoxylon trugodes TaxID=326681 RepID=UPI00219A393D|nr:uncharacterized protein F4822DRAFT_428480 [Hypoxylon trugodes]KAI1390138.1 hypothetical protein F4822DRAFT_428480 [Hypoxylon trugodes]